MDSLACIILAAGQSKRMKSRRSKALHEICGAPLLERVIETLRALDPVKIVTVVSPETPEVEEAARALGSETCYQHERLGTGHAALQAEEALADFDGTILLTGVDIPLLREETLRALAAQHAEHAAKATVLTAAYDDPTGYGRVVREEDGSVSGIVEHRDADEATLAIKEINSSVYCFDARLMFELVKQVGTDNEQGEMYLTDVIGLLVERGERVEALLTEDPTEIAGINNRVQLAEAESILRWRIRERLMIDGVTLIDPAATYIDDGVTVGRDTIIWPGTFLRGKTTIGEGCEIGPHAQIVDSTLGDEVLVKHGSLITESEVGSGASVGPFAHIRPECVIGEGARAGSYTEMKRARLGPGAKAGHQSYLGDAEVGAKANIGAGAVTCNYDGANKHRTVIGPGAFVGTNSSIVAPVTIGEGAYVGAGSVITKDVPPGTLAIERSKQRTIENWTPPKKKE